jgi:hypothetical protein
MPGLLSMRDSAGDIPEISRPADRPGIGCGRSTLNYLFIAKLIWMRAVVSMGWPFSLPGS